MKFYYWFLFCALLGVGAGLRLRPQTEPKGPEYCESGRRALVNCIQANRSRLKEFQQHSGDLSAFLMKEKLIPQEISCPSGGNWQLFSDPEISQQFFYITCSVHTKLPDDFSKAETNLLKAQTTHQQLQEKEKAERLLKEKEDRERRQKKFDENFSWVKNLFVYFSGPIFLLIGSIWAWNYYRANQHAKALKPWEGEQAVFEKYTAVSKLLESNNLMAYKEQVEKAVAHFLKAKEKRDEVNDPNSSEEEANLDRQLNEVDKELNQPITNERRENLKIRRSILRPCK